MIKKEIDNNIGQTCLFKINKKSGHLTKYGNFVRFMFLVKLEYLNEKESFIEEIYVKDNKVLTPKFEPNDYTEGIVNNMSNIEIEEKYDLGVFSVLLHGKGKFSELSGGQYIIYDKENSEYFLKSIEKKKIPYTIPVY